MPVAAENALEIDLVDLALHPARKSRQRVFKAARGRIERLEFVALISRESRVRDREKETLVRETCVRVPLFRACVCFPFSLSLPFPRLSLLLVYLSCLSLSLSSLSRPFPFCLRLAPTFSFSRRDKPSANVLDGRCSDGGSATRRCMSLRLCATSTLFSSLYLSLSLVISFSFSLNAHRKSRATLHFTMHAVAAVRTLRHQHLHFARAVRARRRDLSTLVVPRPVFASQCTGTYN